MREATDRQLGQVMNTLAGSGPTCQIADTPFFCASSVRHDDWLARHKGGLTIRHASAASRRAGRTLFAQALIARWFTCAG
jgi:hypothetical protein